MVGNGTIEGLLNSILQLINNFIIPLLIALAVLAFFYGLVKYIWGAAGGEAKADGLKVMTAGIIGLVVMLGVWGIVALVGRSLGINGVNVLGTPTVGPGTVISGAGH